MTKLDFGTLIRQGFKFGLVGIFNTLLTAAIYELLTKVFGIGYIVANVISYLAGTVNSYVLNRKFTFKSKGAIKKESRIFFVIAGTCYLLQLMVAAFLVEYVGVNKDIAFYIAMVFYTAINFFAHKFVTFKEASS